MIDGIDPQEFKLSYSNIVKHGFKTVFSNVYFTCFLTIRRTLTYYKHVSSENVKCDYKCMIFRAIRNMLGVNSSHLEQKFFN